jgi:hypothetical protein
MDYAFAVEVQHGVGNVQGEGQDGGVVGQAGDAVVQ